MKVSVYKEDEGRQSVLVQATPGSGLPPVVLPNVTRENLRELVLAEVTRMRSPRVPTQVSF